MDAKNLWMQNFGAKFLGHDAFLKFFEKFNCAKNEKINFFAPNVFYTKEAKKSNA